MLLIGGMGEQMHTPSHDIDAMQTLATLCEFSDTENCIPALQADKVISEKEARLSRMKQLEYKQF